MQNTSVSNATESGSSVCNKNTTDYQNNYADVKVWLEHVARTGTRGEITLQVSTCPSATAYEEVNKTTVADDSMSVGDTVITVTSSTNFKCWSDIINFGDQYEYRVISVATNDLNIVRKDETIILYNI